MDMENDKLTMEISSDESGAEVAVLKIAGTVNFSGIPMLTGFFDKITAEDRNYVVIDMLSVNSICSAALGEFMGYRKKLADKGGNLVFAGLISQIRSKLTLLGANRIFSFYPDVRSAINAYKWDYKKQSKSVTVAFPPVLKLVPPVRQLASRLARQNGYSVKDAFRIETIVDEVCNNAVDHGYKGKDAQVSMCMTIDKEKVELIVTNQSDPEKISVLSDLIGQETKGTHVGDDDKRGRGLALIRMLSNDMNVNINERGTSVHVTKLREE
jgi:anti-sigma regulatory factor (Ser/Thr protein kinase)/anti-anti-sigma regulatory factor